MQVGQLITRVITTYDGTGLSQFQDQLLRGVKGAEAASRQIIALDAALGRLRSSSDTGTRALGGILTVLSAAAPLIDRLGERANLLGRTFQGVAQFIVGPIASIGGFIKTSLIDPVLRVGAGFLSLINPLTYINGAMQAAGRIGEIAFGVAIFNALSELTREAIKFVNALSPLSTGIFAGEIGTQLKALAVTAANAGLSFEQVKGSVNGVRILGIEASEAIKAISQGFQVGLNPSQIQELARAAQDMAVVIGTNSSEAFNRLFQAIATGNVQLLRFAGIMKDQDQLIQDFSRTSGKSVAEIRGNINLLRQAFFQGILTEAKQFAGAYEASLEELGKRLSSFPRQFNDLRLGIGRLFEPFLSGAFSVVEEVTESLSRLFFVTKKGAQENTVARIQEATGIDLTTKQLVALQLATIKGGDEMEKTFQDVAVATGTPVEKLKELAEQGAFSADAIAKIGKAFEPTTLGNQVRALSYAVGSIIQGLARSFFGLVNEGQKSIQEAIPGMIQSGIKFVANFATGIVAGINQFVIPGLIRMITAITQFLATGSTALLSAGASMAANLVSGLISGVASGLATFGNVVASLFSTALGSLSNGLFFLADAKNWGKDIPGAATEGVDEGKFDFFAALKELLAAASITFTDPNAQPTAVINNWGRGIIRAVLESLQLRDFSALSFLEGIIRSLFGQGAEKEAVAATNAVAQALADLNATGAISASTLASLASSFGAAFGDIEKYLQAVNAMNIGLDKQEQLEEDLEDATDAVQAAQERLRQFEEDSAGIPERYTRGRRAQLQAELDAAQKEQEKKRDALRDQQKANEKTREALDLQRALIQELVRAAELQAKIAQDAANTPVDQENVPVDDIDAQLKRIANEFRAQIIEAFGPVRDQFAVLGNIIRGFLGLDAVLPEPPKKEDYADAGDYAKALSQYQAQVAEQQRAVGKGQDLRTVLDNLANVVVPAIQAAFEKVKSIVSDIYDLVLRLTTAAQGFVAAITGSSLPAGSQDTGYTAGQRDPKATENADAAAGFGLGQKTLDIINAIKDVIAQVQAFAAAHPDGVKIIAALAGIELTTGAISTGFAALGGTLSAILVSNLIGGLVSAGSAIATSLFAAIGEAAVASVAGVGLPGAILGAIGTGLAALATPEFFVGFLIAIGAALALAVPLAGAALGYSVASAIAESIGNALGFDVDFPGISESLTKLKDAFTSGGLPKMVEVAGELATQLGTAFSTSFDALKTGLGEVISNGFLYLFGPLLADLKAFVTDPGDSMLGIVSDGLDAIAAVFTGAKDSVSQAAQSVGDAIVAVFSGVYTTLVGASIIPDLVAAIISIFTAMPSGLAEPLANVAAAIIAPFQSAADAAQGLIARITGQDTGQSDTPAPQSDSTGKSQDISVEGPDPQAIANAIKQINTALGQADAANTAKNNITDPVKAHFADMKKKVGDEDVPEMAGKVTKTIGDLASGVDTPAKNVATNIRTPIVALGPVLKNSMTQTAADVISRVTDMIKPTTDLKTAFTGLGTAVPTALKTMATAVTSNFTAIKTGMQGISKEILKLIEDVEKAFQRLGQGPVLKAIGEMVETMLAMFRQLFDKLVGHSIVPDLVDGIVGEFQDLDPRTESPLKKFTTGVENTIAGIDGKFDLRGTARLGNGGGGGGGKFEVTINQSNWTFPANMDARQQEQLRRIAREEAYTGITLAFTKATGAA